MRKTPGKRRPADGCRLTTCELDCVKGRSSLMWAASGLPRTGSRLAPRAAAPPSRLNPGTSSRIRPAPRPPNIMAAGVRGRRLGGAAGKPGGAVFGCDILIL